SWCRCNMGITARRTGTVVGATGKPGPPGPSGNDGAPGRDGRDGTSGSTHTEADYVQPALGSPVAVTMQDATAAVPNAGAFILGGGNYIVFSVAGNVVTLINSDPANSPGTILAGAVVTFAGLGAKVSPVAVARGQSLVYTSNNAYEPRGHRDVLNVTTYGAKGDGSVFTDDVAIQAA